MPNALGKHLCSVPNDRLSEVELLPTLLTLNHLFTEKESQYYQKMSYGKDVDDNENLWQVRSLLGEWKIEDSWLMIFPLLFFLCTGREQFPSPSKWAVLCPFPSTFLLCLQFPKQPRSLVQQQALPIPPPLAVRDWERAASMAGRGGQPLCLTAAPRTHENGGACPKVGSILKLSVMTFY